MRSLRHRIERVETQAKGKGKLLVVHRMPSESNEDALRRMGETPDDDDFVIYVNFRRTLDGEQDRAAWARS